MSTTETALVVAALVFMIGPAVILSARSRVQQERQLLALLSRNAVLADHLNAAVKQRDEARIEVCELSSNGSIDDAARTARIKGWGYLYNEQEKEDR